MCFKRILFGFFAFVLLGVFAELPAAEAERYVIDPVHSNILFLIDHQGFARIIGEFQEYEGEFVFDQENVENSEVRVTIQTGSIDTDHEARDEDLRSPSFFNVLEFPEMTFESRLIERTGEKTARMKGNLTLLGVTKPVVLDVTFNRAGQDAFSSDIVAGFSARGTFKRSEFGMTYAVSLIGDEVELMLEIEGRR